MTDNNSLVSQSFSDLISKDDVALIKQKFEDPIAFPDDDINVSADQTQNLIIAIRNGLEYPKAVNGEFDYDEVVGFLEKLCTIFKWEQYEYSTLGKVTDGVHKKLRWYAVILIQWMSGLGLSNIMRQGIRHHVQHPDNFWINKTQTTVYKDNVEFRNILFADTLEVIDNIILFSLSNYFLRFSNEYKKIYGITEFDNNWYEYVEYGTTKPATILLQRIGFTRENATYIRGHRDKYILQESESKLLLSRDLLECNNQNVREQANMILLNMPKMFEPEGESGGQVLMQKIDKTDTLKTILSGRKYTVDYFQREYRWGQKQIEQMLTDFQSTFEEFYDPDDHDTPEEVMNYGFYYMGCIICTGGSVKKIIDGQQRLTSLTLLLIYLNNLQKENVKDEDLLVPLDDMIYSKAFSKKSFNIEVADRETCMQALLQKDENYVPMNESAKNMLDRYEDIENLFPDELKGEALPYFINWLIEKVLLLEIDTPSDDEAHTIFLTMNDRGLSLNSAEMMKAFIIQQVAEADRIDVNRKWQDNINRIKEASFYDTSGMVNTQDVEFISIWLRAKYANSMRETKRGAKDEDYELLGDKFHTWVRNNVRTVMNLVKPKDYKDFVLTEMTRVTDIYLRMKQYGSKLTPEYEEVFYNANRDLFYQTTLAIAAICNDDTEDVIAKKIQMTAKFVDDFATIRIMNFKKVNWNTNKYLLFHVMQDIRNADCKTIGMVYVRTLRRMDVSIEGITRFSLNQFSGRYMLHILARFTSYVNVLMGNPSHFEEYVDRKRQGNTYDIEHILPDKYEDYKDSFTDYEDFESTRNQIGNLILLTRDKNRSYQAMPYTEKVQKYAGDNILAQALNDTAYSKNPKFLAVVSKYGFHSISDFSRQSIADRAEIYMRMASDIWNPDAIKELAGGWTDDEEKDFFKNEKGREFTVGYAERSWPDALKYGFLSANLGGSGKSIYNVQVGDTIYCHIAGYGFVGIGECASTAVPMKNFKVMVDGTSTPVADAPWESEESKEKLDPNKEVFIGVAWKKYVTDINDGYWEKGMTTVPLVAYMLNDRTTHQKVREHFGYDDNAE